jgi:hypothetical protein
MLNGTNLALIKHDILFNCNAEVINLAFIRNIYYFRNTHLSIHMDTDLKPIANRLAEWNQNFDECHYLYNILLDTRLNF